MTHILENLNNAQKSKPEEAGRLFLKAWSDAENDFERFIEAFLQLDDIANRLAG